MSHAALHIVRPAPDHANDHLHFERRRDDRYTVAGRVTAVVARPTSECFFGEPNNRICSLRLTDLSDTGMGALSQEPIPVGVQITVFIAPHGAERGYDMHGIVVRCSRGDQGHRVGIRFHHHMAAA